MSRYITEVSDDTFKDEVTGEKGFVLVDFWASWCMPCNMMAPLLEKVAADLQGKMKICKLNIEENQKRPSDFGIMSVPTLIIFKDGKEEERIIGVVGEAELTKRLRKYIG